MAILGGGRRECGDRKRKRECRSCESAKSWTPGAHWMAGPGRLDGLFSVTLAE